MHHRYGRPVRRKQSSAWGLTLLLLIALVGTSLVNEPEGHAATSAQWEPQLTPVFYEPGADPAFADRAYALSVEDPDSAARQKD